MVAHTSLDVTLYVHCLSCSMYYKQNSQHSVSTHLHQCVHPTSSPFQTTIQTATCVILYSTLKPKWDFLFEKLFQSQLHCFSLLLCVRTGPDPTSDNWMCTSSNLALCSVSPYSSSAVPKALTDARHTHLQTVPTADLLSLSSWLLSTVHSAMQNMMPIPVGNDSQQDANTCHKQLATSGASPIFCTKQVC